MRVGVTGNYASGKGTVCGMFQKLGAIIIDTDIIAREIVEPGSKVFTAIISAFGNSFINTDGSLNRRLLGAFIFADPDRVRKLNAITHPEILSLTLERSANHGSIYMINAPLLFEAGFDSIMDQIIIVSSDYQQSIERGQSRDGLTKEEIQNRLSSQISLNEKIKQADYVIDNSKNLEFTHKQVCEIWNNLITKTTVP